MKIKFVSLVNVQHKFRDEPFRFHPGDILEYVTKVEGGFRTTEEFCFSFIGDTEAIVIE